ncbi:MAG: response regulator transcription factor [Schwartzia sp.]|nr:response regulator transcription factor [Schwartzia sp. (in: firmicutes)]
MIQIAIVDDEMIDLVTAENFLWRHIKEWYPKESGGIRIDTFSRGEDMISAFEPGSYDLVILDICMEGVTGMQVAEVIRSKDQNVSILFLTGSDDYIMEGYRVFADGYFIKPLADHEEEFENTFRHIFPRLMERYRELPVQSGGISFSVPYRNIRYVDIDHRHQLRLHLTDRNVNVTMTYDECREKLLADARFLECHHRILVNMDMINSMQKEDFVLTDGEKVPISYRRQKEAKAKYMHYLVHR